MDDTDLRRQCEAFLRDPEHGFLCRTDTPQTFREPYTFQVELLMRLCRQQQAVGLRDGMRIASHYTLDPGAHNVHPDIAFKDMSESARMVAHMTAQGIACVIEAEAQKREGGG